MTLEETEVSGLDSEEVRSFTYNTRSRRLHIFAGTQGHILRRLRSRKCLPCSEAGTEF
ncbi:hypothetical protein PAMP_006149 [Pampus punctatissimus]